MEATPPALLRETRAPVLEVFASFQGEGRYAGEPQVFLRLFGCPLRCRWCDTPGSWRLPREPRARVATPAGTERHAGWATPARACEWVAAAEPGVPRTISVTGGEPLLWPGFVRALRAAAGGRRVHLETAGAHPEALAEVLASVDHVSLDLKLPADLEEPVPVPEAEGAVPHGEFAWAAVRARTLDLLRGRDACLKLLVAGGRRAQAFTPLLDEVRARAPELPLFVQPVTPANGVRAPDPATLVEVAELARARGLAVRVVPQIHRLLGVP